MKYIDLSHPISAQTPVYPGDQSPVVLQTNSVKKDGFAMHNISLATHVGTHIDAPSHMLENAKNISDYQISKFFGRGVLVDAREYETIEASLLDEVALKPGDFVIVYTSRATNYNQREYFTSYPEITLEFAQKLVDAKVSVVGMDQASPDYSPFNTHKLLLQNDILIIENMCNLNELVGTTFNIVALPINLNTEASPVRVIAEITN